MDVPIPVAEFLALCEYREKIGCKREIFEMAGAAVRDWLNAREHESSQSSAVPALNGYQWKELYLPSGTILRTVLKGQNYHATVVKDSISFDGQCVTPSAFANSFGCAVRNAWKVIWLLFPGESVWKLAAACREHQKRSLA